MNTSELLTVRETAARLGQGESTIRRKIREGSILAVRLGESRQAPIRVPAAWLESWLYAERTEERSFPSSVRERAPSPCNRRSCSPRLAERGAKRRTTPGGPGRHRENFAETDTAPAPNISPR
jgi:excisionase family DNA binding protein